MSGTLTTQFGYDADGRRVLQTLPDGTQIVYVGGIEVTITSTQRITKTYYAAGAKLIAMRVVTGAVSALYFVHTDHPSASSGQAWSACR
ncbi:MAG: hypothetical protein HZB53_07875 [Chloroflexi bacterium]|nr:hypothetical protein [Chloroflexota bacterium]